MVEPTFEQLPLPGQIWVRHDGDHAGYKLLVTRVGPYHVKGRTVGMRSRGPNRGNEQQKSSVPIAELQRHYSLFRDTKRGRLMAKVDEPPNTAQAAQLEIERIRRAGVPPKGTPERGAYVSLFARVKRRTPGVLDDLERLLLRLYTETDVPVQDIYVALGADANRLTRALRASHTPHRRDMAPFRPKIRISAGEELIMEGRRPMFRKDGLMRPVFPEEVAPEEVASEEVASEEVAPEVASPEVPRQRAGRPKTRKLSPGEEAEVLRLYEDLAISTSEIQAAYNLSNGALYGLLSGNHVTLRARRPGFKRAGRPPGPKLDGVLAEQSAATREHEIVAIKTALLPPESNVSALVLPTPPAAQVAMQRAWAVSFTVRRTEVLAAPTLDEAVRLIREQHGADIDITSVQRT